MRSRLFPNLYPANFARYAVAMLVLGLVTCLPHLNPALAIEVDGCGRVGEGILVDYRKAKSTAQSAANTAARTMLKTIEDAHFTIPVETLQRGHSTTKPAPDIIYTLERVPNHYRALISMITLSEREKTSQAVQSQYSVECWFRRGIAIFPDDNTVRMLYAQYLYKSARGKDAEEQLSIASRQADDNPFTLHNIGLVYFDAKNYEQSLLHAQRAYALGLANPTLKDQLKSVGKWTDPPEASPVEPEPAKTQ